MRRTILLILTCLALTVHAQDSTRAVNPMTMGFGYLSYDTVLRAMPEYGQVQQQLTKLRSQYEAELKRVEQEFNRKYEEFLDGRADFPPTILRKRQSELQELMQRNVDFRNKSVKEISEAETRLMQPLKDKLSKAIVLVGHQEGLAFILNTDQNACPFINPTVGTDVTQLVRNALQ
jgi:outer membrane protein